MININVNNVGNKNLNEILRWGKLTKISMQTT